MRRRRRGIWARLRARLRARLSKRYAAASLDRLTGDWLPVEQGVNELIAGAAPRIRSRVRQLVRDMPHFTRAVNLMVDLVVGQGHRLQARILGPGGTQAEGYNQAIEDAWQRWAEEADVAGRLHFGEIQRLARRQEEETGEYIIVMTSVKDPRRFLPLALQVYEPDQLTDYNARPRRGNELVQGIEVDPATGRAVAYHLEDPWGGRVRRIPAEQVIHGYHTLRPGQVHGVSPFAPVVLLAHDLDEYVGAELDAAKLASKYLAMVTTPNGPDYQADRVTTDESGHRVEDLKNAIIEYLLPGEKVNLAKPERPGDNFERFARFCLQAISITRNLPYYMVSGDTNKLNFSTLRGVISNLNINLTPEQRRHQAQLCAPVYRAFLDWAVLSGRLKLPGYWSNPWPWQRCQWYAPGLASPDPAREGRAWIEQIKAGLASPQQILAERGLDWGEVLRELKAFYQEAERLGVPLQLSNAPLKNNPAAILGESQ